MKSNNNCGTKQEDDSSTVFLLIRCYVVTVMSLYNFLFDRFTVIFMKTIKEKESEIV